MLWGLNRAERLPCFEKDEAEEKNKELSTLERGEGEAYFENGH